MKLTIIIIQLFIISGIVVGLFFIEIPIGNREVSFTILGGFFVDTVHSIKDMMNKKEH
jgi:hypothetical protein